MRKLRILAIDTECLPGHWIGGDYVSKLFTAVAFGWLGDTNVHVDTHYHHMPGDLAAILAEAVESADIVIGHYIRGFDLPLLNGNLLAGGFSPLPPVMTNDTKLDLNKAHGRSLSQENLASQLGLAEPKVKVTLPEWEAFNTKQPGAEEKGMERVVQDVRQNQALFEAVRDCGWLDGPKEWTGTPSKKGGYRG